MRLEAKYIKPLGRSDLSDRFLHILFLARRVRRLPQSETMKNRPTWISFSRSLFASVASTASSVPQWMFQTRPYPSATRWGNCCSWNSGVRLPVDTSYPSSWNSGSGGSPKWNLIFKPLDHHEFFAKWYQHRKDLPLSCESQLIGQNLDRLRCAFKGLSSKTIWTTVSLLP